MRWAYFLLALRLSAQILSPIISGGTFNAPVLVQSTQIDRAGSGTTLSAPAISSVTGDLIAVCTETIGTVAVTSVTDTALNTYVPLLSRARGGNTNIQMFFSPNITGNASNVITVNYASGATFSGLIGLEYSGIQRVSPLDVDNVGVGATTTITSGKFTTASKQELVLGCTSAINVGTITPTSPYTNILSSSPGGYVRMQGHLFSSIQTGVTQAATFPTGGGILVVDSFVGNAPVSNNPSLPIEALPSLGWDSWRAYGTAATETNIKANADAMVSNGMQAVGYQYVVPNDNWANARVGGALQTNAALYPSGMTSLGTYIHADGLKYGFYASPTSGCNGFPASGGFEFTDAAQFAGFGIDLLMYDNCVVTPSNAASQAAYQAMGQALVSSGRSIHYRVSTPYADIVTFYNSPAWGATVGGTEVITAPDLGNTTFATFTTQLDQQFGLEVYVRNGRYNFPDYLGTGNGTLTDTEGISNMSLWSVLASPLYASIVLSSATSNTLVTLENTAVIAVDQDAAGIGGKRVSRVACGSANCEVYARQLTGSNNWAIVLFNRSSTSQSISATWSMFGQTGPYNTVSDLWVNWPTCTSHNCSGVAPGTLTSTGYTVTVPSHGVAMLTLAP